MKNLEIENSTSSTIPSNKALFKDQSTQTILTSLEIEQNNLLVEVEEAKKGKVNCISY